MTSVRRRRRILGVGPWAPELHRLALSLIACGLLQPDEAHAVGSASPASALPGVDLAPCEVAISLSSEPVAPSRLCRILRAAEPAVAPPEHPLLGLALSCVDRRGSREGPTALRVDELDWWVMVQPVAERCTNVSVFTDGLAR